MSLEKQIEEESFKTIINGLSAVAFLERNGSEDLSKMLFKHVDKFVNDYTQLYGDNKIKAYQQVIQYYRDVYNEKR